MPRYIDVDVLKANHGMKNDCSECDKEVNGFSKSCQYDTVYTLMDFCGWLDDMPTVTINDLVEEIKVTNECSQGSDLISRQAAISALGCNFTITGKENAETAYQIVKGFSDKIKELPSVQPMQRGWICPVCGRGLSPFTMVCPCQNGKGWKITCKT